MDIAFIGDCSSGKSSVFNMLKKNKLDTDPIPPTKVIDSFTMTFRINDKETKVRFFDTSGSDRFYKDTIPTLKSINGVVLFLDVTKSGFMESFGRWWKIIKENCNESVYIIILCHKFDLSAQRVASKRQIFNISFKYSVPCFETSIYYPESLKEPLNFITTKTFEKFYYQPEFANFEIGKSSFKVPISKARALRRYLIYKNEQSQSIKDDSNPDQFQVLLNFLVNDTIPEASEQKDIIKAQMEYWQCAIDIQNDFKRRIFKYQTDSYIDHNEIKHKICVGYLIKNSLVLKDLISMTNTPVIKLVDEFNEKIFEQFVNCINNDNITKADSQSYELFLIMKLYNCPIFLSKFSTSVEKQSYLFGNMGFFEYDTASIEQFLADGIGKGDLIDLVSKLSVPNIIRIMQRVREPIRANDSIKLTTGILSNNHKSGSMLLGIICSQSDIGTKELTQLVSYMGSLYNNSIFTKIRDDLFNPKQEGSQPNKQ